MTVRPTGGLALTGKSMDEQIADYLKRWGIHQEFTYPISKSELWSQISRPGNLKDCHPFCKDNEALEWDENSHSDRLEYLNGMTYIRQFLNWNEGEGYDLVIGEENGLQSYVVWQITELNDNQSSLSITVYPYLLANLNKALSFLPFVLYIRPKLRTYLKSVLRGFAYYAEHNQPVPRNHWGKHSWFS